MGNLCSNFPALQKSERHLGTISGPGLFGFRDDGSRVLIGWRNSASRHARGVSWFAGRCGFGRLRTGQDVPCFEAKFAYVYPTEVTMNGTQAERVPSNVRSIPSRRVVVHDPSHMPADYSTTPGGTVFSTTPGGMFNISCLGSRLAPIPGILLLRFSSGRKPCMTLCKTCRVVE